MKKFRNVFLVFLLLISFFSFSVESQAATIVNLGGGYSVRIDPPHEKKTGKYHGHVYKGNKQVGAENVDGTKHDGKDFKNVPKKTLDKLKNSKEWKGAQSKNKKLVEQRSSLSWSKFLEWFAKNIVIS